MLTDFTGAEQVYITCGYTDLRRGIDMGSPLYRQEQELNRQGISLSRQTMSNWILRAAEDYLRPVYEQLHRELLSKDVFHADGTMLQVLHKPNRKPQSESYILLYRTS